MSLNLVTLIWDVTDLIQVGLEATLTIEPTVEMYDQTDHIIVPMEPRVITFLNGAGTLVGIVANDNVHITPGTSMYSIGIVDENNKVLIPTFSGSINAGTISGGTVYLDTLL